MSRIIFVRPDGSRTEIPAAGAATVMRAALAAGLPGIAAECGGSAMCATCHVYVDPAFLDRLPPVGAVEDEMLACTASPRRPGSRLSCQIAFGPALDGLVVHLPERQV